MDGGAWWATVHNVAKIWTWLKWLSSSSSHTYLTMARPPHSSPWSRQHPSISHYPFLTFKWNKQHSASVLLVVGIPYLPQTHSSVPHKWSHQVLFVILSTNSWWLSFSSITIALSLVAQMVKNWPAMQETLGAISGAGRSPEGGNGNPLQYSCLGSPMHRGAWWAAVHGVSTSQTRWSD